MIIVNATLEPVEGKLDEIVEKAEKLLKASRTHEGNISYNLYKNYNLYYYNLCHLCLFRKNIIVCSLYLSYFII